MSFAIDISFTPAGSPPVGADSGALVVLAAENAALLPAAAALDAALGGLLARAIATSRFKGKAQEVLAVATPAGAEAPLVLLLGVGDPAKLTGHGAEQLGGALVPALNGRGIAAATLRLDAVGAHGVPALAAAMAAGALQRSYRFDIYRTVQKPDSLPSLKALQFLTDDTGAAQEAFKPLAKIVEGQVIARDLVSEPANILFPEEYARRCEALRSLGLEVEVLDEPALRKLGMNLLLSVSEGSAREARVVVLRWNGTKGAGSEKPVCLIGKGVTFDTGGISLKPPAGMEDMKWDMGGSAAVVGTMAALAGRQAKVDVVGIVGLVENMPSGNATRPGDVVTSAAGQTVEIINTDAEGRLVLADVLWYAQEKVAPRAMVDLATLTGAIIVALGHDYAGCFCTDDAMAAALLKAGEDTGEKLWRMPFGDSFDRSIDSDIADIKNVAAGREGGSIVGAAFLKRFVKDVPWAHLDIAGMAWAKKDGPLGPRGAAGYGVRLLDRWIADNFEA